MDQISINPFIFSAVFDNAIYFMNRANFVVDPDLDILFFERWTNIDHGR